MDVFTSDVFTRDDVHVEYRWNLVDCRKLKAMSGLMWRWLCPKPHRLNSSRARFLSGGAHCQAVSSLAKQIAANPKSLEAADPAELEVIVQALPKSTQKQIGLRWTVDEVCPPIVVVICAVTYSRDPD